MKLDTPDTRLKSEPRGHNFWKNWMKRAAELRADEKQFHGNLPTHLQRLPSSKKILLWKEILVKLGYPDYNVVDEICQGFFHWRAGQSNQQYSESKWSLQQYPFSNLQEWPEVWTWLLQPRWKQLSGKTVTRLRGRRQCKKSNGVGSLKSFHQIWIDISLPRGSHSAERQDATNWWFFHLWCKFSLWDDWEVAS